MSGHARAGAWLLVAFLVPVTLAMHAFWNVPDPMMRQILMAFFMKNLAMLGGALLTSVIAPKRGQIPLLRLRLEARRAPQKGDTSI